MKVSSLGRFELASRIVLDAMTGSWFVVGMADEQEATLLGEDVENLLDDRVAVLSVSDRASLVGASREHSDRIAVFFAPVRIEDLHLDDARSLLQREHAGVLALPTPQLSRLAGVAPHFTSWVGDRVFGVEDDRFLDDAAQEERLDALREHYGMSDEVFVAKVERGDLAPEPEHVEWLVLLGRQDLVGGRP